MKKGTYRVAQSEEDVNPMEDLDEAINLQPAGLKRGVNMMNKRAQFGSVSLGGTLRRDSFMPCLISKIISLAGDDVAILRQVEEIEENGFSLQNYYRSEESDKDLEILFKILNDFAPRHGYFGAHESDESDYGFWLGDMDDFVGLRVGDISQVPPEFIGEVLVTDEYGRRALWAKLA